MILRYMSKTQQLTELRKEIQDKFKGKKIVLGKGRVATGLMIIVGSPSKEEQQKGKMFVGETGKVLDQLLKELKLKRNDFYITPAVKFTPKFDKPKHKEIKRSSFFIKQEIKIVEPSVIIALGNTALKGLGVKLPLQNIRGRLVRFGEMNLFATYSPEEMGTDHKLHDKVHEDFQTLKGILEEEKKKKKED